MTVIGYSLIDVNGAETGKRREASNPPSLTRLPNKPYWVPVEWQESNVAVTEETILERTRTVEANRVLVLDQTRDLDTLEREDKDNRILQGLLRPGTVDRVQFEIMFEMINEIRTLKGQGTLTRVQFVNYLKGKFR